ncbi:MAG: histidine phosphatase family protein [Helicobacter sp.]|uniref:histidine phosphatase family protein n=1 Tax=Helicobacter sp. TaxID=218 RepID=UPI002A916AEF|nr:histidine phosphatase family protein [Helicobacter sp.]MDY5821354.1 histidine phosphatase family protein [Helicobacter sp.]
MRSIYASMNDSAALIPSGVRAKLFVRHSIRPGVEGQKVEYNGEMIQIEADFHWGLTREGKIMAEEFSRGLKDEFILCNLVSSESKRCVETLNHIQKGYGINAETSTHNVLKAMWVLDPLKWHNIYEYYNNDIKLLLQKMLDREHIDGVYPVEKSVYLLLEHMGLCDDIGHRILNSELLQAKDSKKKELDIYVSHDGLIMLTLCYLLQKNMSEIEWVYMLEGVFFWREEHLLCFAWRGEKFEFDIRGLV